MSGGGASRELIERWYAAAIRAVDPERCVRDALADIALPECGAVVVVAVGKAATAMYRAADASLGERIADGVIVTKRGNPIDAFDRCETIEAGHPIPDEESVRAGDAVLAAVEGLSAEDVVIALISGGGSALLERPHPPLTLDDMRETTRLVMNAGADIHQLNAVRSAVSDIKGGGLRRAIDPARCVTLMLSDVIGNDPAVIASGPTIVADSAPEAATVLRELGVWDDVPAVVQQVVEAERLLDHVDTSRDILRVVADNRSAVDAIMAEAREAGLSADVAWPDRQVTIDVLADEIVASMAIPSADVLVGGGEASLIVPGDGRGGRNSALALELMRRRHGLDDGWTFAALATDGDDGNSDAAGSIFTSWSALEPKSIDDALARSDSAGLLATIGAQFAPGMSGTNVNDVYIALRAKERDL